MQAGRAADFERSIGEAAVGRGAETTPATVERRRERPQEHYSERPRSSNGRRQRRGLLGVMGLFSFKLRADGRSLVD